jgi:hypothetical protein
MTIRQISRRARGVEDAAEPERWSVRLGRVLGLVVTPAVAGGALLLGLAIAMAQLLG